MKLYQILFDDDPGFTIESEARMKEKVDWYNQEHPEMNASYREISVDYDEIGLCYNDYKIKPKWEDQCSVGLVRIIRSGTRDGMKDDGKCNSCPKFIPDAKLEKIYSDQQSNVGLRLR